jgi:hypothetical protein
MGSARRSCRDAPDRPLVAPLRHPCVPKDLDLSRAEGLVFGGTGSEMGIEADHQVGRGLVEDIPEGSEDGACAGELERAAEPDQAPKSRGLNLMQGPGYDQESTPGLVAAGATAVIFTTGNGTTIGNAIAPVIKLASNNRVFEKMSQDLDISAGNVIEGSESISEVGTRLFEHLRQVASGDIQTKAELLKHREFQFWAEQTVSL